MRETKTGKGRSESMNESQMWCEPREGCVPDWVVEAACGGVLKTTERRTLLEGPITTRHTAHGTSNVTARPAERAQAPSPSSRVASRLPRGFRCDRVEGSALRELGLLRVHLCDVRAHRVL